MKAEGIGLVGPPGSGKDTQGERIAREGRIPIIGMSDVMRAKFKQDSEFERYAKGLMARRELLPDHITNRLWADAVHGVRGYTDIVLNGYPRTAEQFDFMRETLLKLDIQPVLVIFVVRYDVTNERRLTRIAQMREQGLEPRPDDLDEAVHRAGFETYQRELSRIMQRVQACETYHHYVNAERDPETVYKDVVSRFHLPHINSNMYVGELTAQ